MPAQPLSTTQLAEAAKLKNLFKEWQRQRKATGLRSSQEDAAELLGFGQSALAQYLNGRIPLNVAAALKFADLLGVAIADFSPSVADQASKVAESVSQHQSAGAPDVQKRVGLWKDRTDTGAGGGNYALPPELRALVLLENLNEREAVLIHKFRISSEEGKRMFETTADVAEKDQLFVVHDQAKS